MDLATFICIWTFVTCMCRVYDYVPSWLALALGPSWLALLFGPSWLTCACDDYNLHVMNISCMSPVMSISCLWWCICDEGNIWGCCKNKKMKGPLLRVKAKALGKGCLYAESSGFSSRQSWGDDSRQRGGAGARRGPLAGPLPRARSITLCTDVGPAADTVHPWSWLCREPGRTRAFFVESLTYGSWQRSGTGLDDVTPSCGFTESHMGLSAHLSREGGLRLSAKRSLPT
jgi:hypothetical protein